MAQIEASRANTLDRVLNDIDLPDLSGGYFSYPVDDFFGDYVDALGQRGMQSAGSLGLPPAHDAGQYDSMQFPGDVSNHLPLKTPLPSAMSLDLPLIPDVLPEQPSTAPQDQRDIYYAALAPSNNNSTSMNGNGMPTIGDNYSFAAQPTQPMQDSAWVSADKQSRKVKSKKQPEYHEDSPGALEDSDEADQKGGTGKGSGKTRRNPKQQAQNKQAQQRYRERRKQRFSEMENAIDGLNAKLEQMQAVQRQNAHLQVQRNELEANLSQAEAQIRQLRAQLEDSAHTVADPEQSPEQRRKAEEEKLRDCQASAGLHIQELKAFLKKHNLENVNPTGEGTDPQIVQELADVVGRGCSLCHDAMRVEGVKVLRLMSSDVTEFSRIKCIHKKGKMGNILQRLALTGLQTEQLQQMRQNHLRNLRSVYEARQQLNMQAMSLMLPPASECKDLDGKMACMSLSGYGKCARQTVDLDEILNSIKENLRLEQKQVMEMNYVTMNRLLSPIQAALFLVNMHPSFCDALELANALVSKVKADSGQNSDDLDKLEYHSPTSSDNKSDTCALMESHQSRDKDAYTTHCK